MNRLVAHRNTRARASTDRTLVVLYAARPCSSLAGLVVLVAFIRGFVTSHEPAATVERGLQDLEIEIALAQVCEV